MEVLHHWACLSPLTESKNEYFSYTLNTELVVWCITLSNPDVHEADVKLLTDFYRSFIVRSLVEIYVIGS